MCVSVVFVPPSALPAFDADARTIEIPVGLPSVLTVTLVRAILRELVAEQPEFGAVCWCGAPVEISPVPAIPHQKTSEQVVRHGA